MLGAYLPLAAIEAALTATVASYLGRVNPALLAGQALLPQGRDA